tara:strand:- start:682 stop:930 length:249 start_codon:yes stop_codon:yes gene_type:complete
MLVTKRFFIPRAGRYVSVTAEEFAAHQAAQPVPPKPRGLGDVVALFAEPIARASDAMLGTHLVGCNSCAERRAALNKLVPKI